MKMTAHTKVIPYASFAKHVGSTVMSYFGICGKIIFSAISVMLTENKFIMTIMRPD